MAKSLFKPIRKNETLKDRAVDVVTAAILNGMIKPGERVNESKLARELHISRAPIREALQQLQEQALMFSVPRRGTFVVTLDEEDIQKINSLRLVMEAEALRLARKNLTPQKDQELEQMVCAMETAEPVPTISSMRTDFAFHQTIWSCSGNEYLQKILTSLTAPLFAQSVRTLLRSERMRMILDSHRPLYDFIKGKSEMTAEQVMLEHLSLRYHEPERFTSLTAMT